MINHYKNYLDEIVEENLFINKLFTEEIKKKIILQADMDIQKTFQYLLESQSFILKDILFDIITARFPNTITKKDEKSHKFNDKYHFDKLEFNISEKEG